MPGSNKLKIIDRKKNIFKLSQGEYIAPEKLENVYKKFSNFIEDIFIYGDSMQSSILAVFQIGRNNLAKFAKQLGLDGSQQ